MSEILYYCKTLPHRVADVPVVRILYQNPSHSFTRQTQTNYDNHTPTSVAEAELLDQGVEPVFNFRPSGEIKSLQMGG